MARVGALGAHVLRCRCWEKGNAKEENRTEERGAGVESRPPMTGPGQAPWLQVAGNVGWELCLAGWAGCEQL